MAAQSSVAIHDELERRLDPANRNRFGDSLDNISVVECVSGLRLSVQASRFHYCAPRDNHGPWYQCEVGFPSERVEALMPFIDGDEDSDPTKTVYGYVPTGVIVSVIAGNGGFSSSEKDA